MKQISFFVLLFVVMAAGKVQAQAPFISYDPVITTGLSLPMQVVNAGDGSNRIFIAQKGGTVRAFNKDYSLIGTYLTMTGITTSGERGLLSMAFHPDYKNNGFFYVYYTNATGDLEIARYKVSSNPNVADVSSKVILKTIPHPNFPNHNGGTMNFGPDGYLYLSTGDGGWSSAAIGDTANNAQNTTRLLGKVLRFAVDTTSIPPYYSIPVDNPFGNEVFAYGLRNPFRWSFDRLNGDMWIGDVGQSSHEEINHRRWNTTAGANYGWRCYEGNNTFNTTGCGPAANYTFPVYTYPTPNPSGAVTGGTVYRGETFLRMQGWYIAADYYTGTLYKIKYDSVAHTYDTTSSQIITPVGLSNFGVSEEGELYATNLNNGILYRLVSDGPVQYTFTGNGNWDVATNWIANKVPPSPLPTGCKIVIRPVSDGECVLNVPQTVPAGTEIIVENDKQFRINGNLTVQ